MSSNSAEVRRNIVELSNVSIQEKIRATSALCTLALTPANQSLIREHDGIAALIALLRDSDTVVIKQYASEALKNVVLNSDDLVVMREYGAINLMIALLRDSDTLVKRNIVGAMWNFRINTDKDYIWEDRSDFHPLVAALKDPDTSVKQYAACALRDLAEENMAQRCIIRDGGIPPLVMLLGDPDTEVKQYATAALSFLANDYNHNYNGTKSGIELIRESGGIVPLVMLLEDPDTEVKQWAATALKNLACNIDNQDEIREAGGIGLLVAALPAISTCAAEALAPLARHPIHQNMIREVGGIGLLVALLRNSSDRALKKAVASVLASLAFNAVNQDEIREAGGIPLLVRLMRDLEFVRSSNREIQRAAILALSHLALNPINRNMIREAGGIIPLLLLLKNPGLDSRGKPDKQLVGIVAEALENLMLNSTNQNVTREARGILTLIILLGDSSKNIKLKVIGVLWNLALNSINQDVIREAGGIDSLIVLLRDPDIEVQQKAVGALQALALDNLQNTVKIFSKEVLLHLERLASTDSNARDMISVIKSSHERSVMTPQRHHSRQTSSDLKIISTQDLILQKELGQGNFGVVRTALWQTNQVAVKQLTGEQTSEFLVGFREKSAIHAGLNHPNIVVLYGICIESMKQAIVVELMMNGSLFDVLRNPIALPWAVRLVIAQDAISGLLHLHRRNIIHRNLKSSNILIDEQMRGKITDFGLTETNPTINAATTAEDMRTFLWMAPELFDQTTYTKMTDVYAIGVILWEISAKKLPYAGSKIQEQMIRHIERGEREVIPSGTPIRYAELITRCWAQRVSERPTADDMSQKICEIIRIGAEGVTSEVGSTCTLS